MSIALVIGGRGEYPWLVLGKTDPVGVVGLLLGIGGDNVKGVCGSAHGVGVMSGESSPTKVEEREC